MTSEDEVILLLGRGQLPSGARRHALSGLALPLDWDLIVERLLAEKVYPLFYRNLESLLRGNAINAANASNAINAVNANNAECKGQQPLPSSSKLSAPCSGGAGSMEEAREQLRRLAKINSFRSTLLTEELVRVLKLLSAAGIPAIPLKGPALAQELYGDPGLRVCVDLDILVPRSMVRRTFDLLRADGYKSEFGPGFFADLLLRHDIEYALRRNDRGFEFMVELHWGVLWGGKAEESVTDQLWADAYPATVLAAPAYALSSEWQILVLAAHVARHQWQGLKWLVDLHELYSAPKFNWEKLNKKANQLGWNELLRISFLASHTLFVTRIPKKYLIGELPAWVKLFPDVAPVHLNSTFFATHVMQARPEKLRYAARVMLIPTLAELRFIALPRFLAFLYYPLRPVRLLCKWTWAWLAKSFAQRAKSGSLERPASIKVELGNIEFDDKGLFLDT
jgi:putative nucleotidyltransferase-like protein